MGKVLRIREVGDPILGIKCKEVDIENINNEILEEIEDLKDTFTFEMIDSYTIEAFKVKVMDLCNKFINGSSLIWSVWSIYYIREIFLVNGIRESLRF